MTDSAQVKRHVPGGDSHSPGGLPNAGLMRVLDGLLRQFDILEMENAGAAPVPEALMSSLRQRFGCVMLEVPEDVRAAAGAEFGASFGDAFLGGLCVEGDLPGEPSAPVD